MTELAVVVKPIILILSCKRDIENGSNDVCRQTWIKEWGHLVDYRFFIGNSDTGCPSVSWKCPLLQQDEIVLEVPDSYYFLPFKTQAMLGWALEKGYTHFFKCDTDTYVHIPRLLKSGFENHYYTGNFSITGSYASGGAGYWVNAEAAKKLVDAKAYNGGEDKWVGSTLGGRDSGHNDIRYSHHFESLVNADGIATYSLRTREGYGPPLELLSWHDRITK